MSMHSKMSAKAFYSQGSYEHGNNVPELFTKSLTLSILFVIDCAANAFNNNNAAENAAVECAGLTG